MALIEAARSIAEDQQANDTEGPPRKKSKKLKYATEQDEGNGQKPKKKKEKRVKLNKESEERLRHLASDTGRFQALLLEGDTLVALEINEDLEDDQYDSNVADNRETPCKIPPRLRHATGNTEQETPNMKFKKRKLNNPSNRPFVFILLTSRRQLMRIMEPLYLSPRSIKMVSSVKTPMRSHRERNLRCHIMASDYAEKSGISTLTNDQDGNSGASRTSTLPVSLPV